METAPDPARPAHHGEPAHPLPPIRMAAPSEAPPAAPEPGAPRWRAWLPRALFEAALIVVSVLLALAVDEWRENRQKAQLAQRALASFEREIAGNRDRLRQLLPYHQRLERSVSRADSLGAVRTLADWRREVPEWSGFRPAFLLTSAWQTAITTGAFAQLDYETASALAQLYTMQTRLDEFNLATLPGFDFADAALPATVRRADVYLEDVTSMEPQLLGEYDRVLALLRQRLPPAR